MNNLDQNNNRGELKLLLYLLILIVYLFVWEHVFKTFSLEIRNKYL